MADAKEFVESAIAAKPVVIFSKSYCPFCVKAIKLFKEDRKIPEDKLNVLQIESNPQCAEIQAYLKEKTGASSVPRVFIKGNLIGGCDDTFKVHNSGELNKLLEGVV